MRDQRGAVVGIAVLQKSLADFARSTARFDQAYFLVDPHGLIAATNRTDRLFTPLWPSPHAAAGGAPPLLGNEVAAQDWLQVHGSRSYIERQPIARTGWSLVLIAEPQGIFASRVLGIIITLQMTTLALVYLVGRERWIHDNIQMERRLELEERARHLDLHATTDPLTELYNRRKFNRELALEVLRAQRYGAPLALVMYDIDRFKDINDTYGHQIGDKVLIELSRFVGAHIRPSDFLARWGGEEFVILAPGLDTAMAVQLANKLREAIEAMRIRGARLITCSFGVAE